MIRVVSAEAVRVAFRLTEPYRIAGRSMSDAVNVVLKVVTGDGRTGYGCAAPSASVTGESPDEALRVLDQIIIPLLREGDANDPPGLGNHALRLAPGAPAARAALDMALLDLQARRAEVPLARLLGQRRRALPTSITLGISSDIDHVIDRARDHIATGFRILKLKIGEDWQADARLIHALRAALGREIVLRVDANQGYSEADAGRFLGAVSDCAVELLEQPTKAADLDALLRLERRGSVPIMADESLKNETDAERIRAAGGPSLVNIKLMKSGGIIPAMSIAAITARAGLGAMIGCNDESRISIAAALHFALAAPNVERADLDGHLDLENDVARGGVRIEAGYILPCDDADGLGVSVDL
jgi:L-alanine-DL-glutamate epimerase-like enolase superfamily enzyme